MSELEIPDSCYILKAWFPERPSRQTVIEIKAWIRDGNPPHHWHGHTHTKPAVDATVVYLDEFDLPDKLVKSGRLAPCPCCTPKHAKYGLRGKIAWFPDEGVIRLLGPQCFASLNREGHEVATRDLESRRKRESDIQRLMGFRTPLMRLRFALKHAIPIADELDRFTDELRDALNIHEINLGRHLREGNLFVWGVSSRIDFGTGESISKPTPIPAFKIVGTNLIVHDYSPTGSKLNQIWNYLKTLVSDEIWEQFLDKMTDFDLKRLNRNLVKIWDDSAGILAKLNDHITFFAEENLATLSEWAARGDTDFQAFLQISGGVLRIGRRKQKCTTIQLPKLPKNQIIALLQSDMAEEKIA